VYLLRGTMSTCQDRDTEGLGAHWTAIVCTCQNRESANAFRKELQIRQQKRLICAQATILAVDDPKPNIGSGSATLNALISVTEWLAAREGHKVVTAEVLYNARVLILLLGATFPFSPCGHAFMPAPNMCSCSQPQGGQEQHGLHTEVTMNIDQLMEDITKVETVQFNSCSSSCIVTLSLGPLS
jgi:hypothetical protein